MPKMSKAELADKFRFLVARNKITGLVDIIDTKTGEIVGRDHKSHDAAEREARRLLAQPS